MDAFFWIAMIAGLASGGAIYWCVRCGRRAQSAAERADEAADARWQAKLEKELADHRQVERELAHLASFAEMAPILVVETDLECQPGYLNPAAQERFPDLKKLGPVHPALAGLGSVLEVLRRDKKPSLHRPIHVGDNVYDQQITLLEDAPGIRIYMSDITELKQADQIKSDFLNVVTHELRSPLTAIQATLQTIEAGLHGNLNADQKSFLSIALANLGRLNRLLTEFLDISKIEAGCFPFRPEPTDMARLVDGVAQSFRFLAEQRHLAVRAHVDPGKPEVFVDHDQITQVFTNLVQNALKFTTEGQVDIDVQMEPELVRCRVSDTGPGLTPEDIPKVFGKFQQFGHPSSQGEKGTGLGLSLCKAFVELHGGRIWVESRPGEGANFIFTLPRISSEEFFHRRAEDLFGRAVARAKALSILRIIPRQKDGESRPWTDELLEDVLEQLKKAVEKCVRPEASTIVIAHRSLCMALPAVEPNQAEEITQRIRNAFSNSGLEFRISCYPRDGNVIQKLLSIFTED
jgi:signal transduction histidine kinase